MEEEEEMDEEEEEEEDEVEKCEGKIEGLHKATKKKMIKPF